MFRSWLSALCLCSCTGEPVTGSQPDSAIVDGAPDSAIVDSALDSAVVDSALDSAVVDGGGDAAACAMTNLIPNGDFASGESGWARGGCMAEALMSAPCGRGLRLFDCAPFGDIHRRVVRKITAKSKFRLRVYFRKTAASAGTPSAALVRFYRATDAGEVVDDEFANIAALYPDWTSSEATYTMLNDADGFDVTVQTGLDSGMGRDEFAVAGLMLEAL